VGHGEKYSRARRHWRAGSCSDHLRQSAVSAAAPAGLLWVSAATTFLWVSSTAATRILSAAALQLLPAVPAMAHVERLSIALHGAGRLL